MINQVNTIEVEHGVCGGGLVGALWALFLRRKSNSVAIFQSYYDLRQQLIPGGRSINLVLNALQQLGIRQQIIENTIPIKGQLIHCLDGDVHELPYGLGQNEVSFCIARNKLSQILYNIVQVNNIPIYFQHELKQGDIQTNQYIFNAVIDCEDKLVKVKSRYMYGTDGAGSVIRELILAKTRNSSNIQWYPADYKQLFLPCSPVTQSYALDPNWVHIWPRGGHMMMGHANSNGTFSLTLLLPSKGKNSFAQLDSEQKIQQYFKINYPDLLEMMPGLGLQFKQNPVGYLGTIKVPKWHYKDKVVLLGDAAHTICPFLWQAVNVGMDDCLNLNKQIQKYGFSQIAFEQYYRSQKPKADALSSITLGNFQNITSLPNQKQFWRIKKVERQIEKRWPNKYWSKYRLIFFAQYPYDKIETLIQKFSHFILTINLKNKNPQNLSYQQIQKELDKLSFQ